VSNSPSAVLDDLTWRGLIVQSTDLDELRAAMDAGPITFYCGFDPTAPSLHIGHLVQALTVRRLQLAGHRPLVLVGGATGLIGDPKPTAERALHDETVVAGWVEKIHDQLSSLLDFDGPAAATMVNNLDWTGPMSAIAFLRDVGKHFSVNRMLDREAVRARLEGSGISFTEFSYVLLQSLDYLELFRRHGCVLQIGGTDQWGNITAGVDLVRRAGGGHAHAFTTPLITRADGTKFGKSEGGAPLLDPQLTSPYSFFQFWLSAEDAAVGGYLRAMSFRSHEEIEALEREAEERPAARRAQRELARELTALVHGPEQAAAAEAAGLALFGQAELADLDAATLGAALAEVPTLRVQAADGTLPPVVDLLADTGLSASRSAARRAVQEGGAYVNNRKVTDVDEAPTEGDLLHGRWLVLRRGKRTVAGIQIAP
jgi:tyrosyl-tRNA synthetase